MYKQSIIFSSFFLMLLAAICSGCSTLSYYTQMISGQITILNNRKSIPRLLKDNRLPEDIKKQFNLILELRQFAETELHLPVEDHYLSYVELNRPYVLWNVFATPEFSLTPKTWCYPVIGCATYRGYFSEEKAIKYANKLKAEGFDVYVGGTVAYSTLGWFDDPIFSTFIHRDAAKLASLIFHELAHQLLYVPDDTGFNESFATAIEQEGLRRWLTAKDNTDAYNDYLIDYERHQQFIALIMKFQDHLKTLYSKEMIPSEKRMQKAARFDALKAEYGGLKRQWKGYSGYDAWFDPELNNAQLITVSTYYELVPAFSVLLKDLGGNLDRFYQRCKKLANMPQTKRRAVLLSLL